MASDAPIEQLENELLGSRARAAILQAIFDGRFGEKLPSEDRLADMLGVSRTTVRTALQGLERDGLLTRQRAIGTRINPHVGPSSLTLQRMIGFDRLLRERGHDVEVEVSTAWGEAGDRFAGPFAIDPRLDCLLIDKAYTADGALALAITDAVPRHRFADESGLGDVEPSLFAFSRRYLSTPIHHAVVRLVPMAMGGDSRLRLEPGAAFLRLHERHYSVSGEDLAFSLIDIDDSFIQLEVVRTQ